jgi:sugar O-acyltransferase (sialic acid O-acetyltransferase NeuD family)
VVADAVRSAKSYDLCGFLDDVNPGRRGETFRGLPVLGTRDELAALRASGVTTILLGVGDCRARAAFVHSLNQQALALGTVIHASAVVAADAEVGAGAFLAANAVVNSGARLGRGVIVNTAAVVEHDCEVGEGAHVSPGALLAGGVKVGAETWIGIGAVVIERRCVGSRTVVGAGSVVTRDIPDDVVAFGSPARTIRSK